MRGSITHAIMLVLRHSPEPLCSYEVFELLPDIGAVVDSRQVKNTLVIMAKRGRVRRHLVNEKRGRYVVRVKFSKV